MKWLKMTSALGDGHEAVPSLSIMTRLPDAELVLVPGNTLITKSRGGSRTGAGTRSPRHTQLQPNLEVLKAGQEDYATNANSLIAAGHVVAVELQTIAAANSYWR